MTARLKLIFLLRPARSGYYVQNFNRGKDGLWRYAGSYTSDFNTPMFNASLRREDDAFVFEFEWTGLGGGWMDKPDAYNNLDVSVSIADDAGKRHILSNVAVPVEVRIFEPKLSKMTKPVQPAPQSKTLARESGCFVIPPGFGVRRCSGAFR